MNEITYGVVPVETLLQHDGLSFLRGLLDGKFPAPPITQTLGFMLSEVDYGRAVFSGEPQARHYNPIGTVHGGFAMTLLDSALACAIHSTLLKGEAYTTLEIKVNLVRPLTKQTGLVRAEGRLIHRGRTLGTSEGDIKDSSGKLYAHATTTCMIFPARE
ncbi:MAG: PaaI family thioesterase [Pseudorhodoplanes sp.]